MDQPDSKDNLERFGNNLASEEKEAQILSLTQGPKDRIDDFNNRFRTLALSLEFNDAALRCIYMRAILHRLRTQLYNFVPYPESLDDTMLACEVIESRNRQSLIFSPKESQVAPTKTSAVPRSEPVIKRSRLTDEERLRFMRQGLCFICSQHGHVSSDCPQKNAVPRR